MATTIYTAAICECDEDGELYNSIHQSDNPDAVVESVNRHFEQEENNGHAVPGTMFSSFEELDGFDSYDKDDCNHYRIATSTIIAK